MILETMPRKGGENIFPARQNITDFFVVVSLGALESRPSAQVVYESLCYLSISFHCHACRNREFVSSEKLYLGPFAAASLSFMPCHILCESSVLR